MDIATLSSITDDDAASGGGDDVVSAAPVDSFSAGAGMSLDLATDTATDPAPTMGPVEDRNSATDPVATLGPVEDRNSAVDPVATLGPIEDNSSALSENLVGTAGAGSLTAFLAPTGLHGSAPDGGGGNVSPASSDNSFHIGALGAGALGIGTLDELMSGAAVIGPSGFGAGGVSAGAGSDDGGNGLSNAGINGFFAALTGSFSPSASPSPDFAAGLNLDSQFSQLVQAMATYSADSPAFASPPITQVSNDLFGTIAAAVHG